MTHSPHSPHPPRPFHGAHAQSYDRTNAFWAPVRGALDFTLDQSFAGAPQAARVLCVGAGTGVEIAYLAERHSGWHFTAVDTSAEMLGLCEDKARAGGWLDRMTIHAGPVETLTAADFDLATSVLVSQFLTAQEARRSFFEAIATRLVAGGRLFSVDLSAPEAEAEMAVDEWLAIPGAVTTERRAQFADIVAVLPPQAVAALMTEAGFVSVRPVFQTLLMRGWSAVRAG